jgi:photosystem II stability/assembly factor-like uncharacterized protein
MQTHDLRLDPRDGRTLLMTSIGGHLGPTLWRSTSGGRTWDEVAHPPHFDEAPARRTSRTRHAIASRGQTLKANVWLEPGHADEPGVWYCGTSPQGLFRSEDGGLTWSGVAGWNLNPRWADWVHEGEDATPGGPLLHSIQIDPRDRRHMTVSCSSGGTFESTDQGASWTPINRGIAADLLPTPDAEYGHDPHCTIMHPADPDRWYQQNRCGIYRLDRAHEEAWTRIGKRMPKIVGDAGFPIVPHPTDRDTVWVLPMDGSSQWPRTSPAGHPAVFVTRDGGRRWERLDSGLPRKHAYWTVLRQAMAADDDPVRTGVYFGTTSGEVWASLDGGRRWRQIAAHLPRIYAVRTGRLAR